MVRLFINIGRSAKVTVRDIIQSIAIEAEIPAKSIGRISIYDKFSFVEVPADSAEKVMAVMHKIPFADSASTWSPLKHGDKHHG